MRICGSLSLYRRTNIREKVVPVPHLVPQLAFFVNSRLTVEGQSLGGGTAFPTGNLRHKGSDGIAVGRLQFGEVLAEVKMDDHAKDKIGSFSRGMLQRVGVAQAILNKPELLILDEPLLGLDPFGRQEFKQIILGQQARGTSVFFSSHILSDVEEICDRVAILNKGKLLCTGTLDELLTARGARVLVAPGHDDILKELVTLASGTEHRPDGGWLLSFDTLDTAGKKLDELRSKNPGAITVSAGHEKLEDFFFRTLNHCRREAGEAEASDESQE